jgi:hypothetical protein
MKEILIKIGVPEGTSVSDLLFLLKTERLAWIVVHPCNGRYFQSDLYYKWSSQGDWLQYPIAHSRKNLFLTEEECLLEALEHMITCSFYRKFL